MDVCTHLPSVSQRHVPPKHLKCGGIERSSAQSFPMLPYDWKVPNKEKIDCSHVWKRSFVKWRVGITKPLCFVSKSKKDQEKLKDKAHLWIRSRVSPRWAWRLRWTATSPWRIYSLAARSEDQRPYRSISCSGIPKRHSSDAPDRRKVWVLTTISSPPSNHDNFLTHRKKEA